MTTLQRELHYEGDADRAPIRRVHLTFLVPVFEYSVLSQSNGSPSKVQIDVEEEEIERALTDSTYQVSIPASTLAGKSEQSMDNFLDYTIRALTERSINDLSVVIPIRFEAGSTMIGGTTLKALYWVRHITNMVDTDGKIAGRMFRPRSAEIMTFLQQNLILLNKDVYDQVFPKFNQLVNRNNELLLLTVIGRFLDQTELDPTAPIDWNAELITILKRILITVVDIQPRDEVTKFIVEIFKQVFNFPITIPVIDELVIAGVFQIRKSDNSGVSINDLSLYDLSIEYTVSDSNGFTATIRIPYDWQLSAGSINGSKVMFSFNKASLPIVKSAVSGDVMVTVTSYEGVVVWRNSFSTEDPALKELMIIVDQVRPATLHHEPSDTIDKKKRLRGQVLELKKECPLKDLTVVVQAKSQDDQIWRVVTAGFTDASGNFSMPYPYGEYVAAQAIVSISPDTPADISIRHDGNKNETISDDFLYLLVSPQPCPHDEIDGDCDCKVPKKAPRLPDYADLIDSDEYTQDIGGSCVNLSTPNRTLSEHSYRGVVRTSDPEVANYTMIKNEDGSFDLVGSNKTIPRSAISLANPIRWQDAPYAHENLSLYQAVTVATGHVLHYKAIFKADGYSLGNLLYSLPLAPGQKKNIVVIDAAHQLQGAETQSIVQGESLAASLLNERDVLDQISGNINEALRGNSSSSTGGVSAGLGAAGTIGFASAALGVAGGYSSAHSAASQNSSRDTSMFFGEKLRQAIMQNAESYRQLNATVVTTVTEGQQFGVTTDVVANHNHCHALTMMYFEVLRHYAIYQELSHVEECVFVPLLMTHFTRSNIYKWSDILANHLLPLPSNTYLQPFPFLRYRFKHPLIPAFDANARKQTNYAFVDFPKGAYCDEPITSVAGYMTLRVNIPRPKTVYDRVLSFPIVTRESVKNRNGGGIFGAIADIVVGPQNVSMKWDEKVKFLDEHIIIYDNFQNARPADVIEVINFKNFFSAGSKDRLLWEAISNLCGYPDIEAFLTNYFSHKTISQWDAVFYEEILPVVFEALVDGKISITPFSACDFTTIGKYKGGERLMRLNLQTATSLARKDIPSIGITYTDAVVNASSFWPTVTFSIENLRISYTTKHYEGVILDKTVGDDLFDNTGGKMTIIPTPMNTDEQRKPRDEDEYLVLKLIEHLNSNVEYYNKILWQNLDSDRRYMLLDGFNIQVFSNQGVPVGSRSLASVIKNDLLGIIGNSLVFPVAAGYRVSQSYITEENPEGEEENVSLFDHYRPLTPIPPYRISVPSRGVFLEAVQGACDACEQVKENSSQDWTKFTTEEPTTVNPVTMPVPQLTDWKAAFKDFAPPLVNIQNAPVLPDPGTGLAGVSEVLGKADVFRDITGLEGTQQNVIRTYLSNQENARAFAEMAQGMAMQQHNTQHSDQIMDSLNAARSSGAISQEDYGKLVKGHLQKQIDGGEAEKRTEEHEQKRKETSPIKSAVELANNSNKNVSASESDSSGNTKFIEVKAGDSPAPKYDFMVPGKIQPIKQQTANACWATVATMMSNWRKQANQSVNEYITSVGTEFVPYISKGLPLSHMTDFFNSAGFKSGSTNTAFPVSYYYELLQKYGPVWVIDLEGTDPSKLHGRLLIGIRGDDSSQTTMLTLLDPATGARHEENLPTFFEKTERVVEAIDTFQGASIPLIIYFEESYDPLNFDTGLGGGIAIGAGPDNQTRVRTFVPVAENTLIVNGAELGAIANFRNWRGLYKNADGSFSTKKRDADRFFDDPLHPGTRKYCAGAFRAPTAINKIVLHETAGFSDYLSISQFETRKFPDPPATPVNSYKAMPHFCVNRDGSIIQFLDVCETVEHGQVLSSTGIGIEFVNNPWGQIGNQDGKVYGGITPLEVPAIAGTSSLNGKGKTTCVYVPSQAQLESLVALLEALFAAGALSSLRKNWMNVVNINPKEIRTQKLDDMKAYFILNNAKVYLTDPALSGINANESSDGWSLTTPGVFNHQLYGSHKDGTILSFYTWLRIAQRIPATEARNMFVAYLASASSRIDGGKGVTMVDVSPIVFRSV